MPKPSLSQQLDAAIEAMLASGNWRPENADAESVEAARFYGPGLEEQRGALGEAGAPPEPIAELLAIAGDLTDLPRDEFRNHLRIELERRATMGSTARSVLEPRRVSPIPEGYHSLAPYLAVKDAAKAIDFYQKAFGATEVVRLQTPDGKIGHAEIQFEDSRIMLSDEYPEYGALSPETVGGTPVAIFLNVEDVDSLAARAAAAGATVTSAPKDYEYGERQASLRDPFGHQWTLSKHYADITFEEFMRRMGKGQKADSSEKPA